MRLNIETKDTKFECRFCAFAEVKELAELLEDYLQKAIKALKFRGQALANDKTLKDQGVQNASHLFVEYRD
ncbi:MAG: ubiquitin family protein [Lactobacillales bacterium]|jgi:hypothetical protein|nr:ubiquitin family protein [Lactobacillales bacterium]